MDIFLHSTLLVAFAEIGDKTQLLAIMLAARYPKQTLHILAGMVIAMVANHTLAAELGQFIGGLENAPWFTGLIAASFVAIGLWVLLPDSIDENKEHKDRGAFVTTLITFFLAEMGDKTQLATVALAAQYKTLLPVIAGTTAGMLIANVPAIFFGQALLQKIPMRYVRYVASALFIGIGLMLLLPLFT